MNPIEKIRIAEGILELIGGRRDSYGILEKGTYQRVREPLTLNTMLDHLDGKVSILHYLLDSEKRCRFCVYDLDIHEEKERQNKIKIFRSFTQILRERGIPFFIEMSKRGGFHIYIFFDDDYPSKEVIQIGKRLSEGFGKEIEFFPKGTGGKVGTGINLFFFDINSPFGTRKILDFSSFEPLDPLVFLQEAQQNRISLKEFRRAALAPTFPFCIRALKEKNVPIGMRNEACFALALFFKIQGMRESDVLNECIDFQRYFQPPLELGEIERTVKSAFTHEYKFPNCKFFKEKGFCPLDENTLCKEIFGKEKRLEMLSNALFYDPIEDLTGILKGKEGFEAIFRGRCEPLQRIEVLDALLYKIRVGRKEFLFDLRDLSLKNFYRTFRGQFILRRKASSVQSDWFTPLNEYWNSSEALKIPTFGYFPEKGLFISPSHIIEKNKIYPFDLEISKRILKDVPIFEEDPSFEDFDSLADILRSVTDKGSAFFIFFYFFSALFVKGFKREKFSFPILFISGRSGTGKTTLLRTLSKLVGRHSIYDSRLTPFAFYSLMRSGVPFVIDEFLYNQKTGGWIREIYSGSGTLRGTKDLTVKSFDFSTSPVFAGEISASERRAHRDRIIYIFLEKIKNEKDYEPIEMLQNLKLGSLPIPVIQEVLRKGFLKTLEESQALLYKICPEFFSRSFTERQKENFKSLFFSLYPVLKVLDFDKKILEGLQEALLQYEVAPYSVERDAEERMILSSLLWNLFKSKTFQAYRIRNTLCFDSRTFLQILGDSELGIVNPQDLKRYLAHIEGVECFEDSWILDLEKLKNEFPFLRKH
ncbi:MAG TPA: hypothetical protein EYP29_05470 [Thermoplasmata archaeon]|nr:hypothetical protein [Thermoplasmata archaeon]